MDSGCSSTDEHERLLGHCRDPGGRMRVSLEQHNVEIQENRRHWERKPVLRKVYSQFGGEIAKRVDRTMPGLVIELGSGMGHIKEHLPDCITTDLFPNEWLDRVEDAYRLTFDTGTVSHLILFDVWHHLEYPGTALREFHRVLVDRGKLIIFDPAMGVLGRFVFGNFHHEPLGLEEEIRWEAPAGSISADFGYYAAQGNASRVFGSSAFREQLPLLARGGDRVLFRAGLSWKRRISRASAIPDGRVAVAESSGHFPLPVSPPCFADAGGAGKAA